MGYDYIPLHRQDRELVWSAIKPDKSHEGAASYGIAQEPIQPNAIGRFCVSGVTVCDIGYNAYQFTPSHNVELSAYYVLPSYADNAPFNGTYTLCQSPIRVWGFDGNAWGQRTVYVHIQPNTVNQPLQAVIGSFEHEVNQVGIYRVYVYPMGYANASMYYVAYMHLPVAVYGRNLTSSTKIMVYPHTVMTVGGAIDPDDTTPEDGEE